MFRAAIERTLKRILYVSGVLHAWHRHRNRDRLTIIMFHRVLPMTDPRWLTSDPEYTLAEGLFIASLTFFKRHYHVVSLVDVLAARAGGPALPERSLLITFDDGWSDSEEFALRHLRAADLPAVVFVVSDAVDRTQPFWQERIMTAWRSGRIGPGRTGSLWHDEDTPNSSLDQVRDLVARMERLEAATRAYVLAELAPLIGDDGIRHMVTLDQLRHLAGSQVAIGGHGETHDPLTQVDARAELTTSRRILEEHLGDGVVTTLSFPHGCFDDAVVEIARAAGYRLMFTSRAELAPVACTTDVMGRVGFVGNHISGSDGAFAPELLAFELFRAPHARA